jgi:hypothetical protein
MDDPGFTFEDVRGPQGIGISAQMDQLNKQIASLKAQRSELPPALFVHRGHLDHRISEAERKLRKLAARK